MTAGGTTLNEERGVDRARNACALAPRRPHSAFHTDRSHRPDHRPVRHGRTGGPLQVALLHSAVVAGLVAFKTATRVARIRDAAVGGISSAMGAIFILLAVGALIGTWNMAGTIPTVVYYGIGLLERDVVLPGDGGHLRARRAGHRQLVDDRGDARRRVRGAGAAASARPRPSPPAPSISGAYFGDKMTPLSETTVLVPSMVGGVTTQEHVGAMIWTSGPADRDRARAVHDHWASATPPAATAFDPAQRPGDARGRVQHHASLNLLPMVLLDHPLAAARAAVPEHLRLRPVRGRAGLVHPARAGRRVRRQARPAAGHEHRGALRGDGQRVRVEHRERRPSTRCSRAAAWPRCSRRSG